MSWGKERDGKSNRERESESKRMVERIIDKPGNNYTASWT